MYHKNHNCHLPCRDILKDLIGPQWHAEKICFKQKAPQKGAQTFQAHFSCQVEFETDEDALYFPGKLFKL